MLQRISTASLALVVLLVPAAGATRTPAPQEDVLEQRTEARAELLTRLEEYAEWCTEKRLFAQRHEVYQLLLELDPDHATARKGLGFKKKKSEWIPPAREKNYRDFDETALLEAPLRFFDSVRPYTDRLADLLQAEEVPPGLANELQLEILRFDADNALVHAMRDEVWLEGRWVLAETADASQRRAEIARLVQASLRAAPKAEAAEMDAREQQFELPFRVAAAPELRVLTTGSVSEARELSRALHGAESAFMQLFDCKVSLPSGGRVYLMAKDGEGSRFLAKHPSVGSRRAEFAALEGVGITSKDWAFWQGDSEKRIDGIVRMAFGYFLLVAFDIQIHEAWIYEGFGLYLTKALIGTRRTWFVQPGSGVNPGEAYVSRAVLLDPATNWIAEAHTLLSARRPPNLEALFEKGASELDVGDLLVAYALAAYLVEAHPDAVPDLLEDVGAGDEPREAVERMTGVDLALLPGRMARWIEESYSEELAPPIEAGHLFAAWDTLEPEGKTRVIERFRAELESLDTPQMRTVRDLLASLPEEEPAWGPPERGTHYDPKRHAPRDPIRRRWFEPDDPRVVAVRRQFFGNPPADALRSSYEYRWGAGKIVVVGDPEDAETVFANAAHGYPPGLDAARVIALRGLDRRDHLREQLAFDHVYTDRDGGVYPGITLYDAWVSGVVIEMPDVDVLGIVHDVVDDWNSWKAPIPGTQHPRLYRFVGQMYERIRRYRTLRESLADHLLIGEPASKRFVPTRDNLHALWVDAGLSPERLTKDLPTGDELAPWLDAWVAKCKEKSKLYEEGKRRHSQLDQDGQAVVRAMARALEAETGD